jgi:carboxypeptidase family protein
MSRRVLIVLGLIAAIGGMTEAAEHTGQVTFGGLPVPGAAITAGRADKQVVTSTDESGVYHFRDLEDGVWSVRVEMLGFATLTQDVSVGPGSEPSKWALTLPPFDEIARTMAFSNGSIGSTGSKGSLGSTASSGSTDAGRSNSSNPPNLSNPSNLSNPDSDPALSAADGFLINGSVNNGAASPFAQMAAFGNNRRGQRSLYNGGLALLLGNSAWDARPFSFTDQQAQKPSYDDVQVLGTFGGPIRMRRWFRNGPTLFFGFQHVVDHNAATQSARVPTLLERNGDFSQTGDALGRPVQVIDPTTGAPFSGTVIPQAQLSPEARALLGYYPQPNADGSGRYNYQTAVLTSTRQEAMQSRLSQSINGRNQLFGSLSYQSTTSDIGNVFGFTDSSRTATLDAVANWSHRFSQLFSLRVHYQFTRLASDTTPFFANRTNVSGVAGIMGNDQQPVNWGPPSLVFASGLAGLGSAQYASNHTNTHAVGAEGIRSYGRHMLTFGGDVRPQRVTVLSQQDARGTFAFTGAASGSDLADFLLGIPHTSSIAFGNPDKWLRATNADAYLNDDWRVNPTLTINAGIRWEYESPFTEAQGRLANLDVAPGFSAISAVTSTASRGVTTGGRYPEALMHSDWRGVQPRLGVAWRPVPGSSLVIRGGYGVYRNTNVYQALALLLAQQPPFSKTFSVDNSSAAPLTLASGFVAMQGTTSNTFAIDPDFRVGFAHNWQVSAQRDLPASLTIIGSYLGTSGRRLMQEFLPNTYPAGARNPCPSCPSGFVYLTSNGSSIRHAAQVQLRRRLRNGLTASTQYTLSKATDNAAAFLRAADGQQTAAAGAYIAQDWLNLEGDRGPSNFDQRHQLTVQLQYTTGMGITGGALVDGLKGSLFKGWTVTSQLTTGSGLPLTPVYLSSVPGTGVTGTIRADLTGVPTDAIPDGYYVNPAAYATPAPGRWGSAGRNSITGPAQFTLNGSLSRAFLLGNRLTLDWRIDALNVLNQVTYSSVNTIVGSPQFGLPNRANTMRKIQSSVRLRF